MSILESAGQTYLLRLQTNPNDVWALYALGVLAAAQGRLEAALLAMQRAVWLLPEDIAILRNLAHIHHDRAEWSLAQSAYRRVLQRDPLDQLAHEGASYVAMRLGDEVGAAFHRERAFHGRALTVAPYHGTGRPIRILLIVSALGGNIDTSPYLDTERFAVTKLVAEYRHEVGVLPEVDLVFNAMGDADRCATALADICELLAAISVPVVNHPQSVLATMRLANSKRFAAIPGIVVPAALVLCRAQAEGEIEEYLAAAGVGYPFIARALGFHTGQYCEIVENVEQLHLFLAQWPGDRFLLSQFFDVRAPDRFVRKYRVMAIAGRLYPVHLAASRNWKVHYVTSAMADEQALRDEEAHFLAAPQATLGQSAWEALQRMSELLALEYVGIDFGLDRERRLVFFEANALMIIPRAAADARWEYRRSVPLEIHAAVDRLLTKACYSTFLN